MSFYKLLIISLIIATNIACVPTLVSYHSAKSDIGEITSAPCSPDDAWRIEIDNTSLEIYPWSGTLGLMFRVPESHEVQLESTQMKLWIDLRADPILLPINIFEVITPGTNARESIKSSNPLVGSTGRVLGIRTHRIYNTTLNIIQNLNDVEQFKFEVPIFRVNGVRYGENIVQFEKSRRPYLQPVNC